jgi:hypothetical protein
MGNHFIEKNYYKKIQLSILKEGSIIADKEIYNNVRYY